MEPIHIAICMLILLVVLAAVVGIFVGILYVCFVISDRRAEKRKSMPPKPRPDWIDKALYYASAALKWLVIIFCVLYFGFLWYVSAVELCQWLFV